VLAFIALVLMPHRTESAPVTDFDAAVEQGALQR